MKQYQDELTRLFPVRRSAEEKAAFRAWAQEEISGLGFRVRVEENGAGRHQNLVVGDPQKAGKRERFGSKNAFHGYRNG